MAEHTVERHPKPWPHLVMSAETWEALKAVASVKDGPSQLDGAGFMGLPVYTDRCPWECEPDG